MRVLLGLALLISPLIAFAGGAMLQPQPAALIYPNMGPILFPSFNSAAGSNPASLAIFGKGTAIQLGYEPVSSGVHGGFLGLATASRQFGFGIGSHGVFSNGSTSLGAFAGMGVALEKVSFGVGIRETNITSGFSPAVDLGMMVGDGKSLTFGFVLNGVESSPIMTIGIGAGSGKKFNIEADLRLPPFTQLSSNAYVLAAGCNINLEPLTLLFRSAYSFSGSSFSHLVGGGIWINQKFHLGVQYATSNYITASLTLVF